ncbi:hypothetical protein LRS74_17265 [Streptomyces sp. LX-29]|uniref:hypothetical protein n=1 Tax=Streptomyces sp. LX-29 TaxID=2900152 RepID=UPI00240E6F60|nr:hypothetical protein [Streptomyces sp. LX-29]WFB08601.1 hypothetical protein LRS74_17265 [Streptomyces sp. LX-29]
MRYIVDITRAHSGSAGSILNAFLSFVDATASDEIELLILETQRGEFTQDDYDFDLVALPAGTSEDSATAAIVDRVLIALVACEVISVASFHSAIRQNVETLAANHSHRVSFIDLNDFAPTTETFPATWPKEFMQPQEVIEHLLIALTRYGNPIRKTDLRSVLQIQDPRFRKQPGTYPGKPRFISDIVSLAAERGLVTEQGPIGSPNPYVILTPKGKQEAHRMTPGEFSVLSSGAATSPPGEPKPKNIFPRRSDEFVTVLRTSSFGPFQQIRLSIYEEIERLVRDGHSTVPKLIRDSIEAVRENRSASEDEKPIPWAKVRTFIISLTNRCPVFLSQGELVSHSWAEADKRVDDLLENWTTRLDGELICFLLEKRVQLSLADVADISGALYNSRNDEHFDRVLSVVRWLLREGRIIEESGDRKGVLHLKETVV